MQGSAPQSTAEIVRRAVTLIADRLPEGWESTLDLVGEGPSGDASLWITATDGTPIRLAIEGKRVVDRRDVSQIAKRMRESSSLDQVPVLAARYLSPPVRKALIEQGISYVDSTGNMRIISASPAIYLADRGEDRDPWRGAGRPRGTLKGDPAARVVRALLDYRQAWRVRDLIETSGASTGATYRVLEYLQREGYVEKQGNEYAVENWETLLRAWSEDSPLFATSRVARFLEPRGVEAFEKRLKSGSDQRYAVTGSLAAQEWVQYAPTKAAYIYVPSIESATAEWSLRANTTAPNIILIEPNQANDVVFDNRTQAANGIMLAATAQVASDLLNGPGREPAEGEALIEWMHKNESEWRRG